MLWLGIDLTLLYLWRALRRGSCWRLSYFESNAICVLHWLEFCFDPESPKNLLDLHLFCQFFLTECVIQVSLIACQYTLMVSNYSTWRWMQISRSSENRCQLFYVYVSKEEPFSKDYSVPSCNDDILYQLLTAKFCLVTIRSFNSIRRSGPWLKSLYVRIRIARFWFADI